jgi:hypothetical protein
MSLPIAIATILGISSALTPKIPSLHPQIDQLISKHDDFPKAGIVRADDAEFLRRVYLDLTMELPTTKESREFLKDPDPEKRTKLIDRLLASESFAQRMTSQMDVWLLDRRPDKYVTQVAWEKYLFDSFKTRKPYDQFIRELFLSDGSDDANRPASKFLLDREADVTIVTRDISRLFLGRNLQCAQCHDHPNISDFKQEDFYSVQSFFLRSSIFKDPKGKVMLAEKSEGEVSFTDVFDKKKLVKTTGPRVPGGNRIAEPKLEKGKEYKVAPAKDIRPIPTFSRREAFARALTTDSPLFARSAANRFWFYLMGRGIVHPLDIDSDDNPSSHPELLDLLAREFAKSNFDVRWLFRSIMLSKAYQASSQAHATVVPPETFAVMNLKSLTPERLGYAMLGATGWLEAERLALGKAATTEALATRNNPRVKTFVDIFAGAPGEPETADFVATLPQTLFLKHSDQIRQYLAPRPGNLTDRLLKESNLDIIIEELFLSILTRFPTDEERSLMKPFLSDPAQRPIRLWEAAWTLLASAEFRFNH